VYLLFDAEYSCDDKVHKLCNHKYVTKADKLKIIEPYIRYTSVLMDKNRIIGFFTATTQLQVKKMEGKIPSWNKNDPELINCVNFYMNEALKTDFILHYIAIHSEYRGGGLFKVFNNYLVELARGHGCKRIIFVVRESNPALYIYKHYGAKTMGNIDYIDTLTNDKLVKSYFVI
jgi:GNAT superfamily N-acetyltransferase